MNQTLARRIVEDGGNNVRPRLTAQVRDDRAGVEYVDQDLRKRRSSMSISCCFRSAKASLDVRTNEYLPLSSSTGKAAGRADGARGHRIRSSCCSSGVRLCISASIFSTAELMAVALANCILHRSGALRLKTNKGLIHLWRVGCFAPHRV
jgi:hypothetical protein